MYMLSVPECQYVLMFVYEHIYIYIYIYVYVRTCVSKFDVYEWL